MHTRISAMVIGMAIAGTSVSSAFAQVSTGVQGGDRNAAANPAVAASRAGEDPNIVNAGSRASRSLGVVVDEEQGGLLISGVDVGGVGEHAGLRAGDRIVALDGLSIQSHQHLVSAMKESVRQSALLVIVRDRAVQRVPLNWTSGSIRRATGYHGSNDESKFNGVGNGLKVGRVTDGSWEHTSGLLQDDRIISLNTTPVTTRAQLIALLLDASGSDGIPEMLVDRGGVPTTVQLHLPQDTLGPGSLSDVTHIIGTRGDLESAIGLIREYAAANGAMTGSSRASAPNGSPINGPLTNGTPTNASASGGPTGNGVPGSAATSSGLSVPAANEAGMSTPAAGVTSGMNTLSPGGRTGGLSSPGRSGSSAAEVGSSPAGAAVSTGISGATSGSGGSGLSGAGGAGAGGTGGAGTGSGTGGASGAGAGGAGT